MTTAQSQSKNTFIRWATLAIVLLLFGAVTFFQFAIQLPAAMKHEEEMRTLVSALPLPTTSANEQVASTAKFDRGYVLRSFENSQPFEAIAAFYREKLFSTGWQFRGSRSFHNWAFTDVFVTYKHLDYYWREPYCAMVIEDGTKAATHREAYVIELSWHTHRCAPN